MNMRRFLILFTTVGLLLTLAAANAQPTPEMPDSVSKFWNRLAKARTIAYTMKLWNYDYWSDSRPGRQIFSVSHVYEVKAQRPNRLSITISPGMEPEVTEAGRLHKEFMNV